MQWEVLIRRAVSFQELENLQNELVLKVSQNPSLGFLVVSEPTSTFTCGRSGTDSELLWSKEKLAEKKADVFKVSRGGKWTYHGPGQILLYPIASLAALGYSSKSAKLFVDNFRETVSTVLKKSGIEHEKGEEPYGLFSKNRKLVSFGLNFRQGISTHGMALYHSGQDDFFTGINPCGHPGQECISLEELGSFHSWGDMASLLTNQILATWRAKP